MSIERQPATPELEKSVWQLQDRIVEKLNTFRVQSSGRTGVCVAWNRKGRENWEMILNKDGEWLISTPNNRRPTIDDLLDTFASLREEGYCNACQQIDKEICELSSDVFFKKLNEAKRQYVEQNKQRLLANFIQGMNDAFNEL